MLASPTDCKATHIKDDAALRVFAELYSERCKRGKGYGTTDV